MPLPRTVTLPAEGRTGADLSPGMAATEDDASLASRALAGDRSAWSRLIARHDRRVLLSLLARGVRVDRARELAQETWLRLYERHRRGELPRLELPGLAIVQAGFLAANERRREQRPSPRSSSTEGPREPASGEPGAEDRVIRREELERARAALARLPAGARRVFELLYQNPGLSHAEAAARLGLSTQRVTQVLCEVRKHLRAAIQGAGHE